MNRKLIAAMIFAFIAVKNPVAVLAESEIVYHQPEKIELANAVSEANIAINLDSLYQTEIMTVDEKAKIELVAYREEIEKEKQAEAERIIRDNASKIEKLTKAGLSGKYIQNYLNAQSKYNVPWEVIAAVHSVETHQSGDTVVTSYAGAQGPMQFMPSTFRAYAQDGDNDGVTSIGDLDDAVLTAGNYLAANGGGSGNVVGALYRYNHDMDYVNHVLSIARSVGYNK